MISLVLATQNAHKIQEVQAILGSGVKVLSLRDLAPRLSMPSEGVLSYEENAIQKAIYIGSELQLLTLADDSGFEVEALGGRPGVCSARYAGTDDPKIQISRILEELSGVDNRRCRFVCALSLFDPQLRRLENFRGEIQGLVAHEARGGLGFGYDPIFIPDGDFKTFGEISAEEKNRISHRALALKALAKQLSLVL